MHSIRRLALTATVTGGFLCTLAAAPQDLQAQRLPIGSVSKGTTSAEMAATFEFRAEMAGVLTVVVRATNETDLVLLVTDADGQTLPQGRSDQDLGGDSGAEQFAVTLPRAGTYRVRVEPFGSGTAAFQIGGSWLSFPELEEAGDPDGGPSTASSIAIGQSPLEDTLNPEAGDHWDWFVLRANQAGMLTVATRSPDGDLVLEAFNEGEYTQSTERSDQDLQDETGNEAITLSVKPGQTFYFKVSTFGSSFGTMNSVVPYRLSVGFIPD
jgi:hypothetical protein